MIIGAHVTTGKGLESALEIAESIGAKAIQIFSSAPQQWQSSQHTPEEISAFTTRFKQTSVREVYIHAPYLINLATDVPALLHKSVHALIEDLQFAHDVQAKGVIVHLGSHANWQTEKNEQLKHAINSILQQTPSDVLFIIENTAGGGNTIGRTIEELLMLQSFFSHERIAFCIDTAHAFASGYDLRSKKDVDTFYHDVFQLGSQHIPVVHANDSKVDKGSMKDRHENIGAGLIGKTGFCYLLSHPLVSEKTFILETPGFEKKGPDKQNIDILTHCYLGFVDDED